MRSLKELFFKDKKDAKQLKNNAKSAYVLSCSVGLKKEISKQLKDLSQKLQDMFPSKIPSVFEIDKKIWFKLEDLRPEIIKKFNKREDVIENHLDEILSLISEREFEIMSSIAPRKKMSMHVLKKDKTLVENNAILACSLSKYPILEGKVADDLLDISKTLESFSPLGLSDVHIVDLAIEQELFQIRSIVLSEGLDVDVDTSREIMKIKNLISERDYQAEKK